MQTIFEQGFLGTKAPLFIDIVSLVTILVPFLLWFGMVLAKKRYLKMHIIYQIILFTIFIGVIGFFEYGIRSIDGFDRFLINVSNIKFFYILLILHIIIALVTIIIWTHLTAKAIVDYKRYGKIMDKKKHLKESKILLFVLSLTAISGFGIYLVLFA